MRKQYRKGPKGKDVDGVDQKVDNPTQENQDVDNTATLHANEETTSEPGVEPEVQ